MYKYVCIKKNKTKYVYIYIYTYIYIYIYIYINKLLKTLSLQSFVSLAT